ncbi:MULTISPECIES: DRTGG domain-containing protein [Proteiniclasticum]|jgi:predicted transcriptional regulator|uniref:Predicted transcriptional regulator containing CBS domains n=1 Tax=Proteiniclasticum ruminis TaxID=398199 RepID=A0A1I5DPU1_9CLOT|nr:MULTISPECIES: DRTGG domain-containing protein [Proteiniclasticum]SFO01292.1 Predicted transcriptional regulator containing CBS domains [Proteiniclasticum ruminis]HBW14097.1 CBS domain-containing protein [Proteiniclasticum sp.]
MAKIDRIMEHIKEMQLGTKLSVRTLAKDRGVSDATAYKAIKLMEEEGYLETLPRTGTIRVESEKEKKIESITYNEIIRIVDGELLGGRDGIEKTIYRFNIGAMTMEAMKKYLTVGGLLIVGNRDEVHSLALNMGVGVLITGGFKASEKNVALADRLKIPIISCSYDTFTTASMINRGISENLIKQTIPYVKDIIQKETYHLTVRDTIHDYIRLSERSGHEKFPVVDEKMVVQGIITPKETLGREDSDRVGEVLRKVNLSVTPKTTVSYVAHIMDWENLPLCPVTEDGVLVGVITRTDILKALQERHMKPMETDTMEDKIIRHLTVEKREGKFYYSGVVTAEFLDPLGNASRGLLSMLMSKTAISHLQNQYYSCSLDKCATDFYEVLGIDAKFTMEINIIKTSKLHSKVDVNLKSRDKLIATSRLSILHTLDE